MHGKAKALCLGATGAPTFGQSAVRARSSPVDDRHAAVVSRLKGTATTPPSVLSRWSNTEHLPTAMPMREANAFTPMDDGRATKLFHKRYDTLVMARKVPA